ncbi:MULTISPECIES: MFS transporter [unclassified Streptomyces]|uniref:MFS transporter n=1 Tax=unclassified Streptomyces TaxID=2593676 RepID=UPI00088E5F20|nr:MULTISPECIES: MFS transporter [unclassified Streptomyces]PBC82063.1 DHA1 family inner membrane transport protein [Streptomyces sp. 2321.6]SDR51673.1 MFS transporter, DHA1 family, inner membrane transport protein [Streptomyces sp. KS_16]SEC41996.1 MFS transporter, DHA1 family, inner membrane transport protein [Streptomyces sp. 2133.1]SNC67333.1 MFS transporter, DHA1 family, inner membrane transport protein [Streptomyces sp. 2114.4]
MPLALLALAVSAFGIGTTEFVMMGLLPDVADDLGTSVPTAGYLVSAYALGVVIGAPLLTALGSRIPRKRMLVGLMAVFTVGNLASALAPTFGLLIAGRLLAGLPHGAFFGVGAVVAARLVREGRQARAVATMFLGLTVANIIGVPAATLLGQQLGWRATFLVVAAIGLAAMASLARLIPPLPAEERTGLVSELRALGNRQVLLGLLTTVFGFAGIFAVYSYLASMMTEVTGFAAGSVPLVLALFGIGMTLGALAAGPLTDRALRPTLYGSLAALALVLTAFHFTAQVKWAALVTVVLIGAVGFLTTTPLQMLVMHKAQQAPTLAAASNQSAFNLANAGGAWVGGLALAAGWGWTSPTLVGAVLAALGLAVAVVAGLLDRGAHDASRIVARSGETHGGETRSGEREAGPAAGAPVAAEGQAG